MACNGIRECTRLPTVQVRDQVAECPLIHLLDLGRSGWQVQCGRQSTLDLESYNSETLGGSSETRTQDLLITNESVYDNHRSRRNNIRAKRGVC